MNEIEPVLLPGLATAPSWHQLAVMVNDGSGSMTLPIAPDASLEGFAPSGTKAAAVDAALRSLLQRMQRGRMAANFHFSFVSFNEDVIELRPPQRLLDVPLTSSYDPTARGGGGWTAIHRGLDAAASIVDAFMRDAATSEVPASAVVVLMSDGEEKDDRDATLACAARLRSMPNTTLAACLFATRNEPAHGEPLLREIVSEPRYYARVYDTEQLRRFFQDSVTAAGNAVAVRGR